MIYLAGSCSDDQRELMENIAEYLRINDKEVYCPFELKIDDAWTYSQEEWSQMVFNADKEAIENCEVFLCISPGRRSTAGTNWEQGYAFGLGKRIIVAQFTDAQTSLMTYCGCNTFINTDLKNIFDDILTAIDYDDYRNTTTCDTVLV